MCKWWRKLGNHGEYRQSYSDFSRCLGGMKQKDIDFCIWAKNKREAKELDGWKAGEWEGEGDEETDLRGDLSLELPKRLAMAAISNVHGWKDSKRYFKHLPYCAIYLSLVVKTAVRAGNNCDILWRQGCFFFSDFRRMQLDSSEVFQQQK